MATVLVHAIPFPPVPRLRPKNMAAPARCLVSTAHQSTRFVGLWRHTCTVRSVAEESSSSSSSSSLDVGDDEVIKTQLLEAIKGINRGIFGVPSAKKSQIEALVNQLESRNPTPDPLLNLQKVGGCWKLVYSTITILGSKRTKLGLRDFISLGDFFQNINIAKVQHEQKCMLIWFVFCNCAFADMPKRRFDVRGLNLFNGRLTIEASFKKASNSRVDINYDNSMITPSQLMSVFRKNYDILLGIFNPEGWLEITYVDDTLRIGRDDKGNIFILERSHESSL
ncbi:hypothetical protein DVH24_039489 [Malus domestica]|uniref:Plastid lipid-associated protein/fibrillin conserved domain-containing protein n=1 Tax=Malus domestica TaxID=3750 RepID=A0A498HY91_MALDO|nr:hypothetical protein DVH24_039489 [Malus domestica]